MEKRDKEVQPDFWVEESNDQLPAVSRKLKRKGPRKLEYIGWGSKPLIEFLDSIGKSTDEKLSQLEVTRIINEYINRKNLISQLKKKKVKCDELLCSLFRKKTFSRNKIYEMLERHFIENNDDSEEELFYGEYESEDDIMSRKRQKILGSEEKAPRKRKQETEPPKSVFAAIIPENIKLLYLKKSLVEDLVKDYESFGSKVVGSYVRIKSDPNDFSQKNSHQLLQVTGVKDSVRDDSGKGVVLQVKNSFKDISISMLSEADFSEEECEDLRERLKASSLTMPTVVELEEKAKILHEDITKHWIEKELALLQNQIDRANEKGWRREYFTLVEYMEKKQLLDSPAEKSRLLAEVPKVTAEVLESEPTPLEPRENVKEENNSKPNSILGGDTDISVLGAQQRVPTESSLNVDAVGSKDADDQAHFNFNFNSSANKAGKIDFTNGLTCVKGSEGPKDAVYKSHYSCSSSRNKGPNVDLTTGLTSVKEIEGIHASVGKLKENNNIVSKDAVYESHFTSSSSGKKEGKLKFTNSVKESQGIEASLGQLKKDNKGVDRKKKKHIVNIDKGAHIQHPQDRGARPLPLHMPMLAQPPLPLPLQMPVSVPVRAPLPLQMLMPARAPFPVHMLAPPLTRLPVPMPFPGMAPAHVFAPVQAPPYVPMRAPPIAPPLVPVMAPAPVINLGPLVRAPFTYPRAAAPTNNVRAPAQAVTPVQVPVINLCDNEEDGNAEEQPENEIWHYIDPQGTVQGPFSLTMLKLWSDEGYFYEGFKVWKTGESQDKAVILRDLISLVFP